jgi:DNA-directed RNA polymerase specialized sigma24 family protein
MNVDDNDPRQSGEGQSTQAPAEPTPGDPSHEPVPPAPSPLPLQPVGQDGVLTFEWTSLCSHLFSITNCLAGAADVVQVVRQRVGQMTAAEWRRISNRHEYIYRMARDQAKDWLAERQRQQDAAKEATVPEDLATQSRRIKQRRVREAFILRRRDGLSGKEIARIMGGISEDTVKEYLAKAAEQVNGRHQSGRKRVRPTRSTQRKKEK